MELFVYENYNLQINKADVFLIKEFRELFDDDRCKEKSDPKGLLKNRALRELSYIYLVYDWKSPYSEYSEQEKKDTSMLDSGMTKEDLTDPKFQAAIKKYLEMQDTRVLKMLNAAYQAMDELRIYFETVDLQERDIMSGKPVYTAKNVVSEIAGLGKLVESIDNLKQRVMKEREKQTDLRGGAEPGLFD
jgi:hypothetical protein